MIHRGVQATCPMPGIGARDKKRLRRVTVLRKVAEGSKNVRVGAGWLLSLTRDSRGVDRFARIAPLPAGGGDCGRMIPRVALGLAGHVATFRRFVETRRRGSGCAGVFESGMTGSVSSCGERAARTGPGVSLGSTRGYVRAGLRPVEGRAERAVSTYVS